MNTDAIGAVAPGNLTGKGAPKNMTDVFEQSLCPQCKKHHTKRCAEYEQTGKAPAGIMWCGAYDKRKGKK